MTLLCRGRAHRRVHDQRTNGRADQRDGQRQRPQPIDSRPIVWPTASSNDGPNRPADRGGRRGTRRGPPGAAHQPQVGDDIGAQRHATSHGAGRRAPSRSTGPTSIGVASAPGGATSWRAPVVAERRRRRSTTPRPSRAASPRPVGPTAAHESAWRSVRNRRGRGNVASRPTHTSSSRTRSGCSARNA